MDEDLVDFARQRAHCQAVPVFAELTPLPYRLTKKVLALRTLSPASFDNRGYIVAPCATIFIL
jgi:hypothetical protein